MWSVDRPNKPEMKFSNFYPGNQYLDILALDVYGSDFNQAYYDSLLVLSKGKPLVLGEVGNPPSLEILSRQPKWGYYVIWSGMVRNTLKEQHKILTGDPRILSLEDNAYRQAIAPFRQVCGLPQLPEIKREPVNFSGKWAFNEERSILDNQGAGNLPDLLEILQDNKTVSIKKTYRLEDADDRITEEKLVLGGENKSGNPDFPQVTLIRYSENGDTILLESKMTMKRGTQSIYMTTSEKWYFSENERTLSIKQSSSTFRGKRNIILLFNKL